VEDNKTKSLKHILELHESGKTLNCVTNRFALCNFSSSSNTIQQHVDHSLWYFPNNYQIPYRVSSILWFTNVLSGCNLL